ncbi:hypothetical protein A616_28810 [Brevibacillus brevis X23]|nr:hypothetical protein A616_28810 [Brevibacillus brevis X23]
MLSNKYIDINTNQIIDNLLNSKARIPKNSKIYIVMKSNFYGCGLPLVSFLLNDIDGIIVNDNYDYWELKNMELIGEKEVIILYPDLSDSLIICETEREKNLFLTVINENDIHYIKNIFSKVYLRVDLFLGNHGIDLSYARSFLQTETVRGVILHINESLNKSEEDMVNKIIEWAKSKKLSINIGGSAVLKYREILKQDINLRFVMDILAPRGLQQNNIVLNARVIKQTQIDSMLTIGYKTDRVCLESGTVVTVSLGYGDFRMLPMLYEMRVPIVIENKNFYMPCYPCMNTCWLYCEDHVVLKSKYVEFLNASISACLVKTLNIDPDEILSSISENIKTVYR